MAGPTLNQYRKAEALLQRIKDGDHSLRVKVWKLAPYQEYSPGLTIKKTVTLQNPIVLKDELFEEITNVFVLLLDAFANLKATIICGNEMARNDRMRDFTLENFVRASEEMEEAFFRIFRTKVFGSYRSVPTETLETLLQSMLPIFEQKATEIADKLRQEES